MTTIEVRCGCGAVYQADASQVGRRLRCRCGRTPLIRRSPRAGFAAAAKDAVGRLRAAIRGRGREIPAAAVAPSSSTPQTLLAWSVWIYLGAALLVWLALWQFADAWWPATVYLYGPRWLLILPLAVLIPAAASLRPRLLLPLLTALLIVLVPVMGLRVGWRRFVPVADGSERLRVISLNLAGEQGMRNGAAGGLASLMAETRPDVVVIQECVPALAALFADLPAWHHAENEGFCLVSRYPLRGSDVADRSAMERVRETGLGGSSAAVRYRIEAPGGELSLVNLHLETPRKGLSGLFNDERESMAANTLLREIESRQIADWAMGLAPSLIVAGDFNMPVESPTYRAGWGGFRNAFSQAGAGFGWTRDNGWIQVRIDHVLSRGAWTPVRAWVGPNVGSDHRPVITELLRDGGG